MTFRPHLNRLATRALAVAIVGALVPATPALAGTFSCTASGDPLAVTSSQPARPTSSISGPAVTASRAPDDPWFARQPEIYSGCWSFDLRGLWGRESAPIVVATIDSGLDVQQPDLQGALWTNADEIAGNGIDDDHNGYVDDVHGADMLLRSTPLEDRYGHGTEVAGLIAARGDNGIGVAGVDWNAQIMPVRVIGAAGTGTSADMAEGIRYAADNGARVINVSLNTSLDTDVLRDALADAASHDALVVASAGNDGRDLDAEPSYPAASDSPVVLSVGATGFRGALASFSNHGGQTVDVATSGIDLPTTMTGARFGLFSGTSASAAVVSGVAALLRSAAPQASAEQVRRALMSTALEAGHYDVVSGIVAPAAALTALNAAETATTSGTSVPAATPFVEVQGRVRGARRVSLELRSRTTGAEPAQARFTLTPRTRGARHARTIVRTAPVRHDAAALSVAVPRGTRRVTVRATLLDSVGHRVGGGQALVG